MKNQKKIKKKLGFTMIELLVVATIIIVLSAVGMVSYRKAGENSRNAKRRADLEIVRQALVLYRADNGYYPVSINSLDNNSKKITFFDKVFQSSAQAYGLEVEDELGGEKEKEGEFEDKEDEKTEPTSPPAGGIELPPQNNPDALKFTNVVGSLLNEGYLTEQVQDPKSSNQGYEYQTEGSCAGASGTGACSFVLKAYLEPDAELLEVRSP